jgi:DNA polymerase-3 subunit epsilon
VYLLYGEGGAPLYVGKSANMRQRVLQHFTATLRSEKEMRLAREVRRIDWQRTAGELGALLREARLVKELEPAYNRQLRAPRGLCGFVFDGKRLRLADASEIDAQTLPLLRGLFRSRRMALSALRELADAHRLCLKTVGFDERGSGSPACFRHQVGRCAGVCAGRENVHLHHARLAAALAQLPGASWPHAGPVGIIENDRGRDATEVHVVDRWCYVGSARSDDELAELLGQRREPAFDYDHYRILSRHLARPGVRARVLAH